MEEYAIEFRNVSKIYKLVGKEKKKSEDKKFYALRNISFQISKGEVVGILGTNGSGKSTMATILAGISEIDEGEMIVNGEQALIAINTGLNNQLTGLENIELKGALLGLKPHRVKEIIDGVADFSELGEFLYQPVKKYSSGMKSRLGFSINLCLDPDILIVDEALSVGDKGFANKCLKRMKELKLSENAKDDDKTIMDMYNAFVSMPVSSGVQLGPAVQDISTMGRGVNTSGIDDGFNNYMQNLSPAETFVIL